MFLSKMLNQFHRNPKRPESHLPLLLRSSGRKDKKLFPVLVRYKALAYLKKPFPVRHLFRLWLVELARKPCFLMKKKPVKIIRHRELLEIYYIFLPIWACGLKVRRCHIGYSCTICSGRG